MEELKKKFPLKRRNLADEFPLPREPTLRETFPYKFRYRAVNSGYMNSTSITINPPVYTAPIPSFVFDGVSNSSNISPGPTFDRDLVNNSLSNSFTLANTTDDVTYDRLSWTVVLNGNALPNGINQSYSFVPSILINTPQIFYVTLTAYNNNTPGMAYMTIIANPLPQRDASFVMTPNQQFDVENLELLPVTDGGIFEITNYDGISNYSHVSGSIYVQYKTGLNTITYTLSSGENTTQTFTPPDEPAVAVNNIGAVFLTVPFPQQQGPTGFNVTTYYSSLEARMTFVKDVPPTFYRFQINSSGDPVTGVVKIHKGTTDPMVTMDVTNSDTATMQIGNITQTIPSNFTFSQPNFWTYEYEWSVTNPPFSRTQIENLGCSMRQGYNMVFKSPISLYESNTSNLPTNQIIPTSTSQNRYFNRDNGRYIATTNGLPGITFNIGIFDRYILLATGGIGLWDHEKIFYNTSGNSIGTTLWGSLHEITIWVYDGKITLRKGAATAGSVWGIYGLTYK